jgi:hypothetical protein
MAKFQKRDCSVDIKAILTEIAESTDEMESMISALRA